MINPRISAVWTTTKPIAEFSCTPCVQEAHTKAEVVHLTPGLLELGNASEDSVVLVNSKRNSAFYLSWVYWENLSFRVYAGPNTAHTFYAEDMLTGYDFKGLTIINYNIFFFEVSVILQ